jgi:hypothetical protein
MLTNQEVFDRVAEHLLTQKQKAKDGLMCKYRTEDGRKCAIGCLIPDDLYEERWEGLSLSPGEREEREKDSTDFAVMLAKNVTGCYSLLRALQYCHDKSYVEDWPNKLRALASDWDLSYEVVDKLDPVDVE